MCLVLLSHKVMSTNSTLIVHKVNNFGPDLTVGSYPNKKCWYEKVKILLESKGYKGIDIPIMPHSSMKGCKKEDWAVYLQENFDLKEGKKVYIGHSVGGALGMYLSQFYKIDHLVLIAPHYLKNNKYTIEETDKEFINPKSINPVTSLTQHTGYFKDLDFYKIKENVKKITILAQKKDPVIPYSQVTNLVSKLQQAKIEHNFITDNEDTDHYTGEEIPKIFSKIIF